MSTAKERQEYRELAEAGLHTIFQAHYGRAIKELLAEVERLEKELAQAKEERDQAEKKLADALDELASYKRNANYVAGIIESEGVYRP